MEKLVEHVYGLSAYLKMEIRGHIVELTVYFRNDGEHYSTPDYSKRGPGWPTREEIIAAYHELF